jgi:phosphoglycerol transferase MdoB-like AlkP superfamily enzyme
VKNHLIFLVKHIVFWLVVFAFSRLLFFVYYAEMLALQGITPSDVLPTLLHAWRLDLSSACYLLLLPCLICAAQMWFKKTWATHVLVGYNALMLLVWFTIVGGELGVYGEWQSKLSYRVLSILQHPSEVVNSAGLGHFIALSLLVLGCAALWLWIFRRWFVSKTLARVRWYVAVPFAPLAVGLCVLGMRGGLQYFPIHQSMAYFSPRQALNDIAVNPAWNLMHSLTHGTKAFKKNPYVMMPQGEAEAIVEQLHHVESDTTIRILNSNRPNIVLLILESFAGDMIESISGTAGITPNFKQLQSEGLMFSQTYSSGKRSPEGMTAILAGHPAMPPVTACDFPEKIRKMPTLTQHLIGNGYHTSFYFGGYSEYGNIVAFIVSNGFARITEGHDLKGNVHRGKLGVHDEDVLAQQLRDLATEPQPFFSGLFTLSSHSPYDQPLQGSLSWDLPQMPYLNSVFYADKCLGDYFDKARQQPWYANTLFILVADHSRITHIAHDFFSFDYLHIPLLLYGEVLKPEFRGESIDRLAMHSDLPKTLLHQLDIDASRFRWSRDLLNPYTQNFVYAEDSGGLRYKCPEGDFAYSYDARSFIHHSLPPADSARIFREGTAYLQVLFGEFMGL